MATGNIVGVLGTLEFDAVFGIQPSIVNLSGTVYAIAYQGPSGSAGQIATINISADGKTITAISSLQFDTVCTNPQLVHISGLIYAVVYKGVDEDGWLKTVSLSNDGLTLSLVPVGSLEFDTGYGIYARLIHVSGTVYALAYTWPNDDGYVRTINIPTNGVSPSLISGNEFDTTNCSNPFIFHVAGTTYAIVYASTSENGIIKTLTISDDGSSISFITSVSLPNNATFVASQPIELSANLFLVAYTGTDTDGFLASVSISSNGLTISFPGELEFETATASGVGLVEVDGYYFVPYWTGTSGNMKSFSVSVDGVTITEVDDGTFTAAITESRQDSIYISDTLCAVAFAGTDEDGFISTVEVNVAAALPTVTTQGVVSPIGTTATGNGTITDEGHPSLVTHHGVCWKTYAAWLVDGILPITSDSSTDEGAASSTGAFTTSMTGLTADVRYIYRAYAQNATGIGYGGELDFTADKGTVYPDPDYDPLRRVSGLIRTFWAGIGGQSVYQAVLTLGGMSATYISPIGEREPQSAVTPTALPSGSGYQQVDYENWLRGTDISIILKLFGHFPTYAEWVIWKKASLEQGYVLWSP